MSQEKIRVRRILVTGDDEQLSAFHMVACYEANLITRREQTLFYTVFSDGWADILKAAKASGGTVQEILIENGEEQYVHVAGTGEGWKPKPKPQTKRPGRSAAPGQQPKI